MFKSQITHNLDDKGRVVLPTKFREKLGDGAVITKGFDGCLTIYTKDGWDSYINGLLSNPMGISEVRRTIRSLTGNACDLEIDKQGRIKVPDYLISAAGINKEVTFVGIGSMIEVWATERWLKEQEVDDAEFEANAEKLSRGMYNV